MLGAIKWISAKDQSKLFTIRSKFASPYVCCSSVSYAPPAYYAHLAAFRGRILLSASSSDSASESGCMGTGAPRFTGINIDLQNSMFYMWPQFYRASFEGRAMFEGRRWWTDYFMSVFQQQASNPHPEEQKTGGPYCAGRELFWFSSPAWLAESDSQMWFVIPLESCLEYDKVRTGKF